MPRKQRFKPSRKPQMPSAAPAVEDRQEIPASDGAVQAGGASAIAEKLDPESLR